MNAIMIDLFYQTLKSLNKSDIDNLLTSLGLPWSAEGKHNKIKQILN
jgi:hypothetical protein